MSIGFPVFGPLPADFADILDVGAVVKQLRLFFMEEKNQLTPFVLANPPTTHIDDSLRYTDLAGVKKSAVISGETHLHHYTKLPQGAIIPKLNPNAKLSRVDTQMFNGDNCVLASFALKLLLDRGVKQKKVLKILSKSHGLLTMNDYEVVGGYPIEGTYKNPMIRKFEDDAAFVYTVVQPDAMHSWIRGNGENEKGEKYIINMDPSINQYCAGMSDIWYGTEINHKMCGLKFRTDGDKSVNPKPMLKYSFHESLLTDPSSALMWTHFKSAYKF
jgi:hypothetical protein